MENRRANPLDIPQDAVLPVRHPNAPMPGEVIPSHYRNCFGCGADHPNGLHLTTIAGEGVTATATLQLAPAHQGAPGIGHGGLLATALDELMGAVCWLLQVPIVTAHFAVTYRAPVPIGDTVQLRAEVVAVKGRKIWVTATVADESAIVLSADALFMQVSMAHFRRFGRAEDLAIAASDPDALRYLESLAP